MLADLWIWCRRLELVEKEAEDPCSTLVVEEEYFLLIMLAFDLKVMVAPEQRVLLVVEEVAALPSQLELLVEVVLEELLPSPLLPKLW